jgi:Kef-type K+ transport system membrane component KefB
LSVEPIQLAALLGVVVLLASIVSVELGVTVALVELTLGVVVGNVFDLQSEEWLDFVASFASIVLTFLAGMEVDPQYMRRRLEASVGIGVVSFVGPFVVASGVAYLLLDWSARASFIAGTALSTTSLAVVYAVLVERRLTDTSIGKLLMSATFVTDLCTALALSAIFVKPNVWFPLFLLVSVALVVALLRSLLGSSAATATG